MKTSAKLLATFVCAICLEACGGGGGDSEPVDAPTTAPWVVRSDTVFEGRYESSPVLFSGTVYHVECKRTTGSGVRVWDTAGNLVASTPSDMVLCSALVTADGVLHIFGTISGSPDVISTISTIDLVHWTAPTTLVTAPAHTTLYNSSVAIDSSGYVMAYEVCIEGQTCFNAKFMRSNNLVTWFPVGGQLGEGSRYVACPTIRYANGFYYVMYLAHFENDVFATKIARSTDMVNWQTAAQAVVSPLDGVDAHLGSRNASDLDLIEVNGQTQIIYWNVSQHDQVIPGTGIRMASYPGSLAEFLAKFF